MDRYAASLAAHNPPDRPTAPAHPLFRDAVLLDAIFAELSTDALLNAGYVSSLWPAAARRRLLAEVRLDSARKVEAFERMTVQQRSEFGEKVRGFVITRSSLPLLPVLPTLTPNLTSLELSAGTHFLDAAAVVAAVRGLPRLERLAIVGQDERSRRRRLLDHEPEGQVGQALRTLAEDTPSSLRLRSLVVRNTPLKLSTIDAFLEAHGERLRDLVLDGCGVDARAVLLAEEFCPDLRECRLDALVSHAAPAATPRPRGPPVDLVREAPLALSSFLTSLHLASLPRLSVTTFSLFSSPHHASLRTLSLLHCDLTAAHLSHFTSVSRLRIVECPSIRSIPVFVDTIARPDLGPGCRALRQLSVLGRGEGLSLENLWELAMLGRDGTGARGLTRLTLDGTSASESVYSVSGILFSFPSGFGTASPPSPDDGPLPSSLPSHLAPPAHLAPFLSLGVLSSSLPPLALLQILLAAHDLEEISIFGSSSPPVLALLPRPAAPSLPAQFAHLSQRLLGGALALLPLVGPLFTPFSASLAPSVGAAQTPAPAPTEMRLRLGAKDAFARDGLPSPPAELGDVPFFAGAPAAALSPVERGTGGTGWRAWLKRPAPVEEDGGGAALSHPRKRLREDQIAWLLDASRRSGGRLRRVYV
ncbi:hypothetical protein JCM10449v2_001350 [Rhodotorula kratochvilovae]